MFHLKTTSYLLYWFDLLKKNGHKTDVDHNQIEMSFTI